MGLGNYFIDKFRQTVRNVQINGPFYFYRNYFGQALNYINLRGGLVAYTHGYNNDPTDIFNPLINGTNYLEENLKRNGLFSINDKYKADNQRTIDGFWPFNDEGKYKNTFSKQRNIGNIVSLDYPKVVDIRNKDYTFDDLQNELRNNFFVSPIDENGTQVIEIYTFPDVLEIEEIFYQKYKKNDFIRALTFEQFSNKVYKDSSLIHNPHDGGLTSYSFYNEDNQENQNTFPLTGNSITFHSDNPVNLIEKTQQLFNNKKIKTLINRFNSELDEKDLNDLDSGYDKTYGYSRGRNLKNANNQVVKNEGGYKSPYCRTWTAFHQYDKLSRRIRPFYDGENAKSIDETQKEYGTLRPNDGSIRLANNTVLDTSGFVRITPTKETKDTNHDIKKCMFSIENLAWKDIKLNEAKISKEQQGPNGGRIMWFPPYNLKFTENINVDWNANKFIGRGEQIYTYTNTDRSGTLNFTLLIDHPSILNKYVGKQKNIESKLLEEDILRYFAGCGDLNGENSNDDNTNKNEQEVAKTSKKPQMKSNTQKVTLIAFFPNDWTGVDYENKLAAGIAKLSQYETSANSGDTFSDIDKKKGIFTNSPINYNSGLKLNNFIKNDATYEKVVNYFGFETDEVYSLFDVEYGIAKLANNITNLKIFQNNSFFYKLKSIKIIGLASSHGNDNSINHEIAKRRANFLKSLCFYYCKQLNQNEIEISLEDRVFTVSDNEKKVINTQELVMRADESNVTLANKSDGFVEGWEEVTRFVDLTPEEEINKLEAKLTRCAYVTFEIDWNEQTVPSRIDNEPNTLFISNDMSESTTGNSLNSQNEYSSTVVEEKNEDYTYDNEYRYFQHIANDGKMQYEYIANKVKYFNPAFHSITPEGFNARLTFLHQCTRQGPTNDLSSGNINSESNSYLKYAGNLAFGRPPYCILRIGDFYNTKICITALSIDYDNGGGIQWDLNQEGIGVQPMFANISINFTFLGGQDLTGPIERLQNAVTANYYANASVYDDKADVRGEDGRMKQIYDPTINKKNS